MSLFPKPCIRCGVLSAEAYCAEHTPKQPDPRRGRVRSHVGRGAQWDKVSKRARELQPWCTDCGARQDLTADHLPSAWWRIGKGLAVRLRDVDVVCRPCNSTRGPAQPGSQRYAEWKKSLKSGPTRGVQSAERGSRAPGVSPAGGYSTLAEVA